MFNVTQFHQLAGFLGPTPVFLKIEWLNPAGSIKFKTAISLIEEGERAGHLFPGRKVIESSSGNLGIALAIACSYHGYPFTCVTDVNANQSSIDFMRSYGAEVIVCDTKDKNGGFLGSRIALIQDLVERDSAYFWTNQYANPANPLAHYRTTAPEVFERFPDCGALFVGAGTTGTLMGCAQYLRDHSLLTVLIAVDVEGSVTFQDVPGKRLIPGLGTSRRPEITDRSLIENVHYVSEAETVAMCRHVADDYGLMVGGSTGSVLAALKRVGGSLDPQREVVVISPDSGERYLPTIYSDDWRDAHFSPHAQAASSDLIGL